MNKPKELTEAELKKINGGGGAFKGFGDGGGDPVQAIYDYYKSGGEPYYKSKERFTRY